MRVADGASGVLRGQAGLHYADGQVAFLQSLGLRTIISLTPEHPTRQLVAYARATGVDFVRCSVAVR